MRSYAVGAAILGALLPVAAAGARFPNAVEKTVTVSGESAAFVARMLGLSAAGSSVSLQLGRNDAWAVYLLKHDTERELTNGDGPARYNIVRLASAPASLSVGPYWLDLGTQLPQTEPGYYSFSSPFLSGALTGADAWTKLVRRLRDEPGWNYGARPEFQRCNSAQQTEICLRVYGAKDYAGNVERDGYSVTITAHPPR